VNDRLRIVDAEYKAQAEAEEKFETAVLMSGPNMLVPWYLMLSYLYYVRETSLVSDHTYDRICKDLMTIRITPND
jgi:hypothetical protein